MRKKILILSSLLIVISSLKAQVGINIDDPQGLFHLDGKRDTEVVGSVITGEENDIVVKDATGRMGIGTIEPTELLEVRGNAKNTGDLNTGNLIIDGRGLIKGDVGVGASSGSASLEMVTQGTTKPTFKINDTDFAKGKYLSSDDNGNAFWGYLRPDSDVRGIDTSTGVLTPLYSTGGKKISTTDASIWFDLTDSNSRLNLTKGKWLILCKYASTGTAIGSEMLIWTRLMAKGESEATFKSTVIFGTKPELSGAYMSTPQLFYIADIRENTTFYIEAHLTYYSASANFVTSSPNDTYFVAIRLSDQ